MTSAELTKISVNSYISAKISFTNQLQMIADEYPDTYIVEESAGLHIAQALKRHGCRVVVHHYAANPQKSPSLLEFEFLSDPAKRSNDIKAVLICCPWEGYKKISFPKGAKFFDPWGLRR